MQLPKDLLSDTYQTPDVILCQTNKDKICKLNATNLEGTFKFNSYSEISFDVPSVYCDTITGEMIPTPYYDYIEGLRLVYLKGFGYFQLQDPEVNGDGIQEYKHINAYSLEYSLSQRYLETFIINQGDVGDTIGSIDGVVLYNPQDIGHSLIHLVLQKAYGWTIGHVDDALATQGRSFEIDRQSIYDFIMNDMCDTFKCYVEFDTINNTVNIYSENEVERHTGDGKTNTFKFQQDISNNSTITINGHEITEYQYNPSTKKITFTTTPAQGDIIEVANEFKHKYDTDIIVSFENLSNEMKVNYSSDDIKTVLTVKGADDLDIRNVNFGLPSIMNLDYYCTPEWMGDKLYNEYLLYIDKQNKYMSGFYSKDISGSIEESFDVVTTSENFVAGDTQEFPIKSTQESFYVNGTTKSMDIDKIVADFDVNGESEEQTVTGLQEKFYEPNLEEKELLTSDPQIESITVQEAVATFTFNGTSYEFKLPSDFNFNDNSIVKINGKVTEDYDYNKQTNTIVCSQSTLSTGDTIEVVSCENQFSIKSAITITSKITLNDTRELLSNEYQYLEKMLVVNVPLNVGDVIKIYTYQNSFVLTKNLQSNSIVYVNEDEVNDYIYDDETKTLTINRQITSSDIVKVCTPLGTIITSFSLSHSEYQVSSVEVDGVTTTNYRISSDNKTLTMTDTSILKYGSVIAVNYVNNHFTLNNFKDEVVSVKIDNIITKDYTLEGNKLTITDKRLSAGSVIRVESISTHFDLSPYKDKVIVSVNVNDNELNPLTDYSFDKNTGTLAITNLSIGDKVSVKLVNNSFYIYQNSNQILSIKVDSVKIENNDYSFDNETSTLTINSLDILFSGYQVFVELINDSFTLKNTRDKIIAVIVDGEEIDDNEFGYSNNKLVITSKNLTTQSHVLVKSIDTHFNVVKFNGAIDSVYIEKHINNTETEKIKITEYSFNKSQNLLTITDDRLDENDTVLFNTIYKSFIVQNTQKTLTAVKVNDVEIATNEYTFSAGVLIINRSLYVGDRVSAEFFDNKFITLNDMSSRRVVEKTASGSTLSETILEGQNGYTYNRTTKVLTIYAPLKNGDKITIKAIDSKDALLVVQSNAKSGQISINDVTPRLKSYEPKVGDYVIKVEGYTEILKELYQLIDNKLIEENNVQHEYEIIEKIVTPENFNTPGQYLPEANISNLGTIYKITNQDDKGNDITHKYYICEMKLSIYVDGGQERQEYKYVWNEREMIFGDEGVNLLKEKEAIYASIQDIQIAAEWDQKPPKSEENKSYLANLKNLQEIREALANKQQSIASIEDQIQAIQDRAQQVSEEISIEKNFAPDSLDRLSLFLREDEYSDDCFCVTDIDTDLDKINTQKELLVAAQKELKKISQPKLSFSASMKNIYAIPEFEPILNQFKLGSFIKVQMRKGYIKKARLLEVQLAFSDLSNFSCTFGDLLSAKDQGDIHADLLAQAVNAGKTVANGSSYWQKGYDVATAIDEKIRQGLIDATTSIKTNSAGQDISWDNYGIHLRKKIDGVLDKHEGWITNNKFLYSDDNFQTSKSVFGNYTIEGQEYWGILAGCVRAGLIEGSTIVGGTIKIGAQVDDYGFPKLDEKGNQIYNFEVDSDGTVTMNKGEAAEKLSYFSFDGDNGLVVGENEAGEYFSRVSAQRIEFCRKARIKEISYPPTSYRDFRDSQGICDCVLYKHKEGNSVYYDYYSNPWDSPTRAIDENFTDPKVKFGVPITYFANNTAYMKQAEIEGNLTVGTEEETPSITLGNFKFQIESNGSLSIVAT